MNGLRIATAVLTVFALTMVVTLGVVCLMYAVYLDTVPRLRQEWPLLLTATGGFAALSVVGIGAWFGLRHPGWRLPTQTLLWLSWGLLAYLFSEVFL
jgi:hypothetical protein